MPADAVRPARGDHDLDGAATPADGTPARRTPAHRTSDVDTVTATDVDTRAADDTAASTDTAADTDTETAPADPAATDPTATAPAAVPLPAWFEVGLLFVLMGVVGCGGIGLALAVVNRYSFALSVGVGGAVAVVAGGIGTWALLGRRAGRPDRSGGLLPAIAALVFVAGQVAWNALHSGGWINIDRDPATYAVAGKWLTNHSGLIVPFQSDWTGTDIPIKGEGAAVYDIGGQLEFQFNHLLAVLLAQAGAIGGDGALLAANTVIVGLALLAVYAVGVRLVGRPWVVLAAVVALGLSLPVLYVARSTFSEGVTMLLVWGGAWLLLTAWARAPLVLGVLGGAALGATTMARIDSLVYLLPLPLVAAVAALALARDERWKRIALLSAGVVVGAAGPVAIGTVDLVRRSGRYYGDLAASIQPLQKASVAALVVGVVVVLLARLLRPVSRAGARLLAPHAGWLAGGAGVLTVLLAVFAWAVRPAVDHQMGPPNSTVAGLQAVEGVTVEAGRTYSEQGMIWLSWYLGIPVLVLATVGLGLMVRRALRGSAADLGLLGVAAAGTLFYLYRISNTPDQLFGVRRYVPAVLPLFVLAAAVAAGALVARLPALLGERSARFATPAAVLLLVSMVVFPLGTAWQVRDFAPRRGQLAAVHNVCDALGPNAAVLFPVASYGSVTYPMTLRAFCGVPTVASYLGLTPEQISHAADVMAAKGYTLWVVDSDAAPIAALYGADNVQELGSTVNPREIATTLTRPPLYYATWSRGYYGAPVPR